MLPIQVICIQSPLLDLLYEEKAPAQIDCLTRFQAGVHIVRHFNTGWSSLYGMFFDSKFDQNLHKQVLKVTAFKSPYGASYTYERMKNNLCLAPLDKEEIVADPPDHMLTPRLKKINEKYKQVYYKLLNLNMTQDGIREGKDIVACSPLPCWREFKKAFELTHCVYSSDLTVASLSMIYRDPSLVRQEYFRYLNQMIKKLIDYKLNKDTNVYSKRQTLKDFALHALLQNRSFNKLDHSSCEQADKLLKMANQPTELTVLTRFGIPHSLTAD